MLRKIFRDPVVSIILIINMALVFFLVINVINLMNQKKESEEKIAQYSFNFDKMLKVFPKGTIIEEEITEDMIFGTIDVPKISDEEKCEFCHDICDIVKEFDGNVELMSGRCLYDKEANNSGAIQLCIKHNEETVVPLINEDTIRIDEVDKDDGIVLPAVFKENIIKEDGNDTIDILDKRFSVCGLRKDYTLDNSDTSVTIYAEQLPQGLLDKWIDEIWSDYYWDYYMLFNLESNKDNAEENYELLKKQINDKGYVLFPERNRSTENKLFFADFNSTVSGCIYIFLIVFSIVNCIYISNIWIIRKQRELVIKKTFGCGMIKIIKGIVNEMFSITVFTAVLSAVLQIIYGKITGEPTFSFSPASVALVIIAIVIITVVNSVIPLIKVAIIQPAKGLKRV